MALIFVSYAKWREVTVKDGALRVSWRLWISQGLKLCGEEVFIIIVLIVIHRMMSSVIMHFLIAAA